jgi:LysM repeat protein
MKRLARALVITLGVGCVPPLVAGAADYLLFTPGAVEGEPAAPEPGKGVLVQRLTIKKGDTLSRLARRYSGKASYYPQILLFNNIPNPNLIYAGSSILVPVKPGKVEGRVKAITAPAPKEFEAIESREKAPEASAQQPRRKATASARKAAAPSAPARQVTAEQALYAKAIGEYKKGHYQDALHGFTRFIAQFPDSPLVPDASLYRAECLFNLSNQ